MLVRTRSHAAGRDGGDSRVVTGAIKGGPGYPLTSRISSVAMTCSACICESLI